MKQVKTTNNLSIPSVNIHQIPTAKKSLPIPEKEIDQLKARNSERLIFSFRFFDRKTDAFNLAETNRVCENWFVTLFDCLSDVCKLTRNELIQQRQHYDAHNHNWEELDYTYPLETEFLEQVECLQFRLSQTKGRVHGFILGNIFYVVWLDPHHNLYPNERFGGLKKTYNKPLTCFENLQLENFNLLKENDILKKQKEKSDSELNNFIQEHEKVLDENTILKHQIKAFEDTEKTKKSNKDKYNKRFKKNKPK